MMMLPANVRYRVNSHEIADISLGPGSAQDRNSIDPGELTPRRQSCALFRSLQSHSPPYCYQVWKAVLHHGAPSIRGVIWEEAAVIAVFIHLSNVSPPYGASADFACGTHSSLARPVPGREGGGIGSRCLLRHLIGTMHVERAVCSGESVIKQRKGPVVKSTNLKYSDLAPIFGFSRE
jgi:hypothetical protein